MTRRLAYAAVVAALFAGGVVATFAVSFATGPGRRADAAAFERLSRHEGSDVRALGRRIGARTLDAIAAACVLIVASVLGVLSLFGRNRLSLAFVLLLIGSSFATTEIVKPRLGELGRDLAPLRIATDAFPSGHATLSMAVVLAAVLAVPAAFRLPATLTAAALETLVAVLLVIGGLHPPSDVAGGYLVAAAWAALASPFVRRDEAPPTDSVPDPPLGRRGFLPAVVAVFALVLFVLAVAAVYVEKAVGPGWVLAGLFGVFAAASLVIVATIGHLADAAAARDT